MINIVEVEGKVPLVRHFHREEFILGNFWKGMVVAKQFSCDSNRIKDDEESIA